MRYPAPLLRFFLVVLAWPLSACVPWTFQALAPAAAGSCRSEEIRWFAPDDARERARLDVWCAGVGRPVMASGMPAGAPAQRIEDVTFVSWNVHVGNGDVRAFARDLLAGAHTDGRAVRHFVLMLQEVVRTAGVAGLDRNARGAARIRVRGGSAPADVLQLGRELGLWLYYVPSMRNGSSPDEPAEDRGSAILSTMPIGEPVAVEIPGERQRRVALVAKSAGVSVAVVHLDALGSASRLRLFFTPWMRDVQTRSAAALLPDGPLVVGADLNTWHGRDELAVRYLEDLFRETRTSITGRGLGLRVLDYMFFRGGATRRARYTQVRNPYGSDHKPLVGWFE